MTDALVLDNSTLKALARCSTEAFVRYGCGYTTVEERAPLKAGAAGHEALARWFAGGSKEATLVEFEEQYRAWADENVIAGDRLTYENTSAVLGAWLDTHPLHAFPFRVRHVEIGFAYPLDDAGEFIICGRIDAFANAVEHADDLYIVEHKFPGRINDTFTKQFRMDSQLSTYIWAAQQHSGAKVIGAYVNAIEFSKLPSDASRKCAKHGVVYAECGALHVNSDLLIVQRTQEQLDAWRTWALTLARRYRALLRRYPTLEYLEFVPQEGWFNGLCSQCGFHEFCFTGRQHDGMIHYDPWSPLATSGAERPATGHKP